MSIQTLHKRLYHIMELNNGDDKASMYFDAFLIVLILCNTIAVMLSTMSSLPPNWHQPLYYFEVVSVMIFTLEYIIRTTTCVYAPGNKVYRQAPYKKPWQQRCRYILTPMAIVDLLSILPFYLSFFFAIDLRILRLLRLTRLIKLGRYSRAFTLLFTVIKKEGKVLIAALSVLIIVMILSATGMHYIEQAAQPEAFGSIPRALWWAINTLTTVGYGDVTPITPLGKLFSGIITILGVGIFALPAGIIASSMSDEMRVKREMFRKHLLEVFADGTLTAHELARLSQLSSALDLGDQEANLLIDIAKEKNKLKQADAAVNFCPHCGKSLPKINE